MSYGCVFTLKRRNRFQCKLCRKFSDQKRYKSIKKLRLEEIQNENSADSFTSLETESDLPGPSNTDAEEDAGPACCIIDDTSLSWIRSEHFDNIDKQRWCYCEKLQEYVRYPQKPLPMLFETSLYDSYNRYLRNDLGDNITEEELVDNFPHLK